MLKLYIYTCFAKYAVGELLSTNCDMLCIRLYEPVCSVKYFHISLLYADGDGFIFCFQFTCQGLFFTFATCTRRLFPVLPEGIPHMLKIVKRHSECNLKGGNSTILKVFFSCCRRVLTTDLLHNIPTLFTFTLLWLILPFWVLNKPCLRLWLRKCTDVFVWHFLFLLPPCKVIFTAIKRIHLSDKRVVCFLKCVAFIRSLLLEMEIVNFHHLYNFKAGFMAVYVCQLTSILSGSVE